MGVCLIPEMFVRQRLGGKGACLCVSSIRTLRKRESERLAHLTMSWYGWELQAILVSVILNTFPSSNLIFHCLYNPCFIGSGR